MGTKKGYMINGLILGCLLFVSPILHAQEKDAYQWHGPLQSVSKFEGQGWENIGYSRLPNKAKKSVRDAVWNLSRSASGLGIRFETDADSIAVQYQVDGNLDMYHFATTGVSGLDLYVKEGPDRLWCWGKPEFKDTIQYKFTLSALPKKVREHELLLPLYNNVKNLKIGVKKGSAFRILPARSEKPIVVYGTSIAQGACASRPGMAWTNILSRKLDYPIVNLGFSGNGRLEPEVIELINEIDASVYVLDCLPNLSPNEERTKEEIQKRIEKSVEDLRSKHPETTILLVQHAGYSDGLVNSGRNKVYETLNDWMTQSFEKLKRKGTKNLYMLSKEEINLSNDAFVDGTHPTDLGMEEYAKAYENKLKEILQE